MFKTNDAKQKFLLGTEAVYVEVKSLGTMQDRCLGTKLKIPRTERRWNIKMFLRHFFF